MKNNIKYIILIISLVVIFYHPISALTGNTTIEGQTNVTGNLNAPFLYGNGSGITSLDATKITLNTMPDARLSSNIVITSSTQELRNKTLIAAGNNIAANSLRTSTGAVNVSSSAAPSSGQYLRASSGIAGEWFACGTSEFTSGTTASLTTTATQSVMVWATGDISQTLTAIRTVELKYAGVRKDLITVSSPSDVTKYRFALMYMERPGAATNDITVTTTGGTMAAVSIMVLKIDK